VLEALANLAEKKLDQLDLAEKLYRQLANRPGASRGKIILAMFLGRHGHVKDVLDICKPLLFQVEIDLAHNQPDSAAKLLDECPKHPDLPPQVLEALANLAEKLYRQLGPAASRGRIGLAAFLGHRHVKEVLDICEPLWANSGDIEKKEVVQLCLEVVLTGGTNKSDPALDRVFGRLKQALAQPENQRLEPLLLFGMGSLRERQQHYQEAESLYQSAVKTGDRGEVAPSALASIALAYNNLAWLIALNDRKGQDALPYIDRAIALMGQQANLMGQQADFLDTRGVVYLTIGNNQFAINDLEKAVKLAPVPSRHFHLAQAYLAAKDREKAKQSLAAAKIKAFEQSGLHVLERGAYQNVLTELGAP